MVRAEAPTSAKPGDQAVVTGDDRIQGWIWRWLGPAALCAILATPGYPVGGSTPEEIAPSVLAAVVSARRGAMWMRLRLQHRPHLLAVAAAPEPAPIHPTQKLSVQMPEGCRRDGEHP